MTQKEQIQKIRLHNWMIRQKKQKIIALLIQNIKNTKHPKIDINRIDSSPYLRYQNQNSFF